MTPASVLTFVAQQHAPQATLYLLLDPLAGCADGDPLQIEALQQTLGDKALTRIPRPDLAYSPQDCPVLVTLAAPGEPPSSRWLKLSALRAQADHARQKYYVCGWLSSTASAETLVTHLLALGKFPEQQGHTFYPVHEPLRLEMLAATFNNGEKAPSSPVEHWLFPDSSGGGSVLSAGPAPAHTTTLQATLLQRDIALIAGLLSSWRRALSLPLTYAPSRWKGPSPLPPHAALHAFNMIQHARSLGLSDPHDIQVLALFRMMVHPRLHAHVTLRDMIKTAVERQESLGKVLTPYKDSAWERVVSDLYFAGEPL